MRVLKRSVLRCKRCGGPRRQTCRRQAPPVLCMDNSDALTCHRIKYKVTDEETVS